MGRCLWQPDRAAFDHAPEHAEPARRILRTGRPAASIRAYPGKAKTSGADAAITQRGIRMTCFGIQFRTVAAECCCGLCGRPTVSEVGPELVVTESALPICRECGRNAAPQLAALLGLAQVADRVGRIKRHTLVPPLEALLELAGAAERYASASLPARAPGKMEGTKPA
jgi:hypothetical protein